MSVIDNIRGRTPATIPQATDIARKLKEAESELATFEAEHGTAALDALSGDPKLADHLSTLHAKLIEARQRVETFRAAHKAAVERDQAARRAQLAALQRTQLTAVRTHLQARDAAAIALTGALEEAAKQFHVLLDRSAKARAACPMGMQWPPTEYDNLRMLVAAEMYRLSASPGDNDGRALPGAAFPHVQFEHNPTAIPAMAEKIKKASVFVLAKLTGKVD